MKLSQRRKSKLYGAIHEGLMQARIALQKFPETTDRVDVVVAQAESDIWNRVRAALDVEDFPR